MLYKQWWVVRAEEPSDTGGGTGAGAPEIAVSGGLDPVETPLEEATSTEEQQSSDTGEEVPPKQAGKDRLNKRFSELTREKYEERARRESAERELAELRARVTQEQPPQSGDKAPKLEDFKDYEAYADARARWIAGEELRKAQGVANARAMQERANQQALEIRSRWDSNEAKARAKFEDYDEVMAGREVTFSEPVALALLDSEAGPELSYYLKSHPDEAQALRGLSPLAAARAIGKLEVKLSSSPPQRRQTGAPPPPKPETGTSTPRDLFSPNVDMGDYIKRRNKQILDRRNS